MSVVAIFVLGIANFAMHRAVLESGHAILRSLPRGAWRGRVPLTMALEFALLLAALLAVASGRGGWGWVYALYTLLNLAGGWLILRNRI